MMRTPSTAVAGAVRTVVWEDRAGNGPSYPIKRCLSRHQRSMLLCMKLHAADREDLGDAKLLLATAQGNVRAAEVGDELADALRNAEHAAEQALTAIRRVRERVLGS